MPLGIEQHNSFLKTTVDVWQDRVFYNEADYPAGYFVASILNFQRDDIPQLMERGGRFGKLFPRILVADEPEARATLPKLREAAAELSEILMAYPPFSLNAVESEQELIRMLLSDEIFPALRNSLSYERDFYIRYCRAMAVAPVTIYHFAIAGWFFELDYLRRLRKRDEDHFAIAAHDCFNSDLFWKEMRELGRVDFEEFSVGPHLESTYVFARNPRDEKKMVFVNRVTFTSLIDFYTFDLFNGLHHGHAPSQCLCCGKYFLTTTGHMPKYCGGISPENSSMTCRQYGAMMRQKEQNKQHPIYRMFTTRTGTIRKHHQRGKISDELRREALCLAESYRDRALMDNDYAADGYMRDMEQEHIYAEARKRLK